MMPPIAAPSSSDLRQPVSFSYEIPGGAAWSSPVRAERTVTFTALGAEANISTLIIAADRVDRLNVPDTLKAQMSACVRPPMVLMSDRGLALASVLESTLDWHDALTGFGTDADLARFGPSSYAADRNDWRRSARTGLVSELTKYGLDERDLHGCVNFFSKIEIVEDERCGLRYASGHSQAGDLVTLRTELDVLLFVSTAPHPMNPKDYAPAAVKVEIAVGAPMAPDDPSMLFREESARALEQSRRVAW